MSSSHVPQPKEALHAYFKPCENSDGEDTE